MGAGIETYTPGHSRLATDFMARRTLASHAGFFAPYLAQGVSVVDCGCGPGSITRDIARRVTPGIVVGIDLGASQIERATRDAAAERLANVEFIVGDAYALPFDSGRFDRAFSHAMVEHLSDPGAAIAQMHRVLKRGGVAGVCGPDWQGFLVNPASEDVDRALRAYAAIQTTNGGDVHVGRKLGAYFREAGFGNLRTSSRYECPPPEAIAELLAITLDAGGEAALAAALRDWSRREGATFAISWCECIGQKV